MEKILRTEPQLEFSYNLRKKEDGSGIDIDIFIKHPDEKDTTICLNQFILKGNEEEGIELCCRQFLLFVAKALDYKLQRGEVYMYDADKYKKFVDDVVKIHNELYL